MAVKLRGGGAFYATEFKEVLDNTAPTDQKVCRRGVSDHASGTVKVTRTQQGYVIDRTEEADNVSKNTAADGQQRD